MNSFLSKNILSFFERVSSRGNKVLIITDVNVGKIYNDLLKRLSLPFIEVPSGELAKSRECKAHIENYLFTNVYGKDTELIAFGGGVVSDLVGFVAATYMRGVVFSIIPTTIIGYVDASVGGKNGINTSYGKNLLGTFYPPYDVCLEKSFFSTLPKDVYKEQCSEVVKVILTLDRELFLAKKLDFDKARELKKEVVAKDYHEAGKRLILNFGHTFAHAYEKVSNYSISHGEAVWKGVYFASFLSYKLNYLPKSDWKMISTMYPQQMPLLNKEALYQAMKMDKKSKNGHPTFVLLKGIGDVYFHNGSFVHVVGKKVIISALEELENKVLCIV